MDIMSAGGTQGETSYPHDTLYHCMKEYNHGPNSRMSITFNSSKGLTNAPGQNNCFLNSAVQVLWHLDAFRRSFRQLSGHSCMGNACIFCALKVMFIQFQYSDKQVLPPDALRQALSETFQNQQRFQMGLMDDAAECFENILTRIHNHIAGNENEDTCTAPHCIPHQKFSMSVSEQIVCGSCNAKSEPFTFNEMVYYVSTGALVTEYKSQSKEAEAYGRNISSFSNLLRSTVTKGDIRSCPENCGELGEKRRDLLNFPDVVSVGLVWESAKSGGQHIRDVVNYCIGTSLDLAEMFHSTPNSSAGGAQPPPQKLQLVGVVCYYGKHYSTFFFHSKVQEWIYFDDASVKNIGPSWSKVCEKLCKGRHQPLLLLYMNPNTQSVDTSQAPKFSTMAPGYEWKNEDPIEAMNSRSELNPSASHNQQSSRQAYTPAPDKLDTRYDEVDAAYGPPKHYPGGRSDGRSSHRQADRQNSGLSRQDSGVSSQSSRSLPPEIDAVSRISSITQHSSDSGSSGHQLSRQESDAASSYSSRASTVSTGTNFSSAVESEDTGYGAQLSFEEKRKDKKKVSLKSKKSKNQQLNSEAVRHHSKSQASLLTAHQSYDDNSLTRDNSIQDPDQKAFSYATLPRKKRAATAPQQPALPVKAPEAKNIDDMWRNGTDLDADIPKEGDTVVAPPSINSRIQLFNGMMPEGKQELGSSNKPPDMKPLLPIRTTSKEGESTSYISRSHVEKIMNQQRKASSRAPLKMMRPTYEEFQLPEEYMASDNNKKLELRFDQADNTSLGSLKDSGYRSLGDRGSNSASSVSSMSAESPTANHSFNFDTREHIYCEPPAINTEYNDHKEECGQDFDEFPPPPPELLNGNHTKQLSEASILSEASTIKHRKTPSVDSLDALPTNPDMGRHDVIDGISKLSVNDSKLKTMMKSADDNLNKSLDTEERNELNASLIYCQQAVSLLSSITNQKPEDRSLMSVVENKLDFCMSRSQVLHTKIVNEKERAAKEAASSSQTNKFGRPSMGELHIDNQTRRETASSDYTPLNMAIHRAPNPPPRQSSVERDLGNHRLSRTDSQLSNSSSNSGRTLSTCSNNRSQSSPRPGSEAKSVHTVPPQLQHSISQLQQRQSQQQQSEQPHPQSQSHKPQRHMSQPSSRPVSQPQPIQRQLSQPQRNIPPTNTRPQSHNLPVQSHSLQDNTQPQRLHPTQQQPPHTVQQPQVQQSYSRQSPTTCNKTVTLPSNSGLYKEVNIPSTLQKYDYIREGYRAPAVIDRSRGCPSPSVIPPPREFQEPSTTSSVSYTSTHDHHNAQSHRPYTSSAPSYGQSNGHTAYPPPYPPKNHQSNHNQPTGTQSNQGRPSYSRELPPKQHSKQNIRDILVQDMLKRQGGQPATNISGHESNRPTNNAQLGHSNQSRPTTSYAPVAKNPVLDEPLWTPPQPSAFDRGLSHYDKPNYHRQNLYGQVNHVPSSRYASNNQSQSLYGESKPDRRSAAVPQQPRISHAHTYSTEL